MRAIGTPGGSVGSHNRRSTPAHSDWISRSFGSPSRLPGGGFATTATCTESATASAWVRSSQWTCGNAARSDCCQA